MGICFTIILSLSTQLLAASQTGEIHSLLKQWEDGINSKDLNLYLSVFDDTMRKDTALNIATAPEEEKRNIEFFSIKKATVKTVKRLSASDIGDFYNLAEFKNKDINVYYFYFDAEVNDNMESRYTLNGKNFVVCVLTRQGDDWKISQFSSAPIPFLIRKGINLDTLEEAKIKSDIDTRAENMQGIESGNLLLASPMAATAITEPTVVRVKCQGTLTYNGKTNYQYWGVAQGQRANVPFQDYIKDVLPNEWDSDRVVADSSKMSDTTITLYQAAYAGAAMVKSFTWYMTKYPWDRTNGFDVNDNYTQCYLHDTRNKQSADSRGVQFAWGQFCQSAFSYIYNWVVWDMSAANEPFSCYYVQSDQDRTYYCDKTLRYDWNHIIYDIYIPKYPSKTVGFMSY